ncbi:hypothetical protein GLOTRDRAFT_93349 [Gloeophyllum trabeum ATCC 11539]|uniref:Uncharacterized protein n=1 Tax=Gloeophyllum trabeum (strain ATCC 11539 / FP-39264 / Madison 617) TaxID=670483 RepID=S7RMV5_GLOTA|nr:uncharacterized protein GLOTRDRAFT_93349 [Gloeophyllum trabeum ATCC 11539]EPQ55800.1 hypothetical protein GLOTRDRAFT_93349 [Gloeophyllum trabeum ATCC 11539]
MSCKWLLLGRPTWAPAKLGCWFGATTVLDTIGVPLIIDNLQLPLDISPPRHAADAISSSADKVLPWRADFCPRGILDDPQLSHTDYSSREAITLWAEAVFEAMVPQPRVPTSNKGSQRDAPERAQGAGKAAQESDSQSMSTPTARSSQSIAKGLPKANTQPSRKRTQSESSTSATGSVKFFLSTSTLVQLYFRPIAICEEKGQSAPPNDIL